MLHSMFKDIQTPFYLTFCPLRSSEIFWEIRKNMGLDSYILNVFNDMDPIYISRCMISLLKLKNYRMFFFSGFHCQLIYGH